MKVINAAVQSVYFFGENILPDSMDDGSPYSVQEIETLGAGGNAGANIVAYAKPTLAMVSVTVGPGTSADINLRNKLKKYRPPYTGTISAEGTFKVTNSEGKAVYNYSQGILVSGGGGTMQADGKLGGVTYTGAFWNLG
ncbi:MAG: hypothetical protein J6Q22_10845 [Prevotella sp.]|nr:hypothetical protein [Prevotella sp.]